MNCTCVNLFVCVFLQKYGVCVIRFGCVRVSVYNWSRDKLINVKTALPSSNLRDLLMKTIFYLSTTCAKLTNRLRTLLINRKQTKIHVCLFMLELQRDHCPINMRCRRDLGQQNTSVCVCVCVCVCKNDSSRKICRVSMHSWITYS